MHQIRIIAHYRTAGIQFDDATQQHILPELPATQLGLNGASFILLSCSEQSKYAIVYLLNLLADDKMVSIVSVANSGVGAIFASIEKMS